MATEFSGKTALVTGASRGIGAATASALAHAGAKSVLIHYNSNEKGAREAVEAVRAAGARSEACQADLATDRGIASLIEFAEKKGGEIDILVNNAGSLVQRAKLLEQTPELFDEVMNLNVKSAYFVTRAVAPHMIAKGGGIIVNLSSIAARNGGGIGATIYAAAKAAVSCMTKGLARELGPHGIRVNAVSPGTVDNDFHVQFSTRQMLDAVIAATPAGRLGTNEEVSDTILFLCSHAARYVQGQTIEINGGMYMV